MADNRPHRTAHRVIAVIATAALTFFAVALVPDLFGHDDLGTATPVVVVEEWPDAEPDLTRPPEQVSAVEELPRAPEHAARHTGRAHVDQDIGVRRWRGIRSA